MMKLTVDLLTMALTTFFQDYMYQKSTVDSLTPMMQPVPERYDDMKLTVDLLTMALTTFFQDYM